MIINVSQISEDDGLRVEHQYPEGQPGLRSDDTRIVARPVLHAKASREGAKVRLTGTIAAMVEVDCGRCLAPILMAVNEAFDLLYLPPLGVAREHEERELAAEDLDIAFYRDDIIDLDDVVREQIELALPMTRLCSDGCRGLCPTCRTNLNLAECACDVERRDPRWAALKDLKFSN